MAASCHSKQRITEEIGTVELVLDSMTLSQQRSIINGLIKSGTIEVAGRLYDLELVLVCDMKALTRVLNLYNLYLLPPEGHLEMPLVPCSQGQAPQLRSRRMASA